MIVLFDIDGVLLDSSHRHHLIPDDPMNGDWGIYHDQAALDEPINAGCALLHGMVACGHEIHFVSARSVIEERATMELMERATGLSLEHVVTHFRPLGNVQPSYWHKHTAIHDIIDEHGAPDLAFEDDSQVAAMYHEHGIPCYCTENPAHVAMQRRIDGMGGRHE